MQNPAVRLYEEWRRTLESQYGTLADAKPLFFGRDHNFGIGPVTDAFNAPGGVPAIGCGYVSAGGYFSPAVVIHPDGKFRIATYLWGWKQRDTIARNTFLRWTHVASEYVWRVDELLGTTGEYGLDRADQYHYMGERAIGMSGYSGSAWLRLEHDGSEWTIRFAGKCDNQGLHSVDEEAFRKYDRLRERRYRMMERKHLIQTGVITPTRRSAKDPAQREAERKEQLEKATEAIKSAFVVTTRSANPMKKATPMKKKEDA